MRCIVRGAQRAASIALVALAGCAGQLGGTGGGEAREHWRQTYDPRAHGSAPTDVEREFNLFRGRWWNYYSRGSWFLETGDPERASADFRVALAQRSDDERDARSYGMHFWEYFPHRELGVALLTMRRHEEAAAELERSLATEDSGRAKFYLNKARAAILKGAGRDAAPPVIAVEPVGSGGLVNTPAITLRGAATDDTYVAGLRIAGEVQLVELAAPRIAFSQALRLRAGVNTVRVEADDLMGRTHGVDVRIILDRTPPVFFLDADSAAAEIVCSAADDRGLASVSLGGKTISCDGRTQCTARFARGELRGGRAPVEVRDLAGNATRAEVDPVVMAPAGGGKGASLPGASPSGWQMASLRRAFEPVSDVPLRLPRLNAASAGIQVAAAAPAAEDRIPPRIEVDLSLAGSKLTTMEEDLFLDGSLYDPGGIAALSVNGEPIPLPQHGGSKVGFSHLVALRLGDNVVEIRASDRAGNASAQRLDIRRVPSEILGGEARYSVGFIPPDKKPDDASIGDVAYDLLLDSILREPVRFRLLERDRQALGQILLEHKLTDLAASGTAVRLGKIISAEGVLFGRVQEGSLGVSLELRLVDTETSEILFTSDVYGEEKDLRSLRWLANGLVSKLKVGFPLLQGEVLRVDGKQVRVSLGKEQGLRNGMRLLFYRDERRGALATQRLLKQGETVMQAKVTEVGRGEATAELVNPKAGPSVRAKDRVVTK